VLDNTAKFNVDETGCLLAPMKTLEVKEGKPHTAKNIGGSEQNRGHRTTGPITSEVNKFLNSKYLRHYGYLDGVMRFYHLKANDSTRKILSVFIAEILAVMKDGGDIAGFSPTRWKNGRFREIFQLINGFNRRRDDLDCPINDLRIAEAQDPSHPKYAEVQVYMSYYRNNSVFGHLCEEFYALVKKLADDIREYDANIKLHDHNMQYPVRKTHFDNVEQFVNTGKIESSVVRVAGLELKYDRPALIAKCKTENVEILYVENLRVLYFEYPMHAFAMMTSVENVSISERNFYQTVAHNYTRIGNGFYSNNIGESDSMELIRSNMTTIECHMRPKFGKFFLNVKKLGPSTNEFLVTITLDHAKKSYQTRATLAMRHNNATYLGYIYSGQMLITDLLRVDDRETNVDVTRAHYDDLETGFFASISADVVGAFDDREAYDVILRCEADVYRARSLKKYRVYDKIGWFYDYIKMMSIEKFDALYQVADPKFRKIYAAIKLAIEVNMSKESILLSLNEGTGDYIVTLDNRYIPPLIVGVEEVEKTLRQHRNYQSLTGEIYELNKYYVLSRSSDKCMSIDHPKKPFVRFYEDNILCYNNVEVSLQTTTFARFPVEWQDELYNENEIDYQRYLAMEKASACIDLKFDADSYHEIKIFQPYHESKEEMFFMKFENMKIDFAPESFLKKKAKRRVRKQTDSKKMDCLGD